MNNDRKNPGADPTGLLQSIAGQSPQSLLRPDVLGRFVRAFLGDLLRAVDDVNSGRVSKDLGVASTQASCGYYSGVLSGRVKLDGFETDAHWHPSGLASFLRKNLGNRVMVTKSDEDVISESLALLAHALFAILSLPEDQREPAVDRLVSYAIGQLGGVAG